MNLAYIAELNFDEFQWMDLNLFNWGVYEWTFWVKVTFEGKVIITYDSEDALKERPELILSPAIFDLHHFLLLPPLF